MFKPRYILITSILSMISLILSGCFYGNYAVREHERQLVNDASVFEDASGEYRIEFHEVFCDGSTYYGGTWYDINDNTDLFSFVFGAEVGTLLVLSESFPENGYIVSMNWNYDDGVFTVSEIEILNHFNINEDIDEMTGQTYTFNKCTK